MEELIYNATSNFAHWLSYLALASVVFLILSVLFIPKIIARIPSNYFSLANHTNRQEHFSFYRLIVSIIKNFIGVILILAGILMLMLPGQGILTIFVGLLLLKFPGKYKLERYLVSRPSVLSAMNWMRRKQNVPELILD